MDTIKKKPQKKLPRMPTTDVCTYELMKNEFAKSMNSSYKTIYYFRGGENSTNKLMFTFYLYLAFIQTRNVKSLSNKHHRLNIFNFKL